MYLVIDSLSSESGRSQSEDDCKLHIGQLGYSSVRLRVWEFKEVVLYEQRHEGGGEVANCGVPGAKVVCMRSGLA